MAKTASPMRLEQTLVQAAAAAGQSQKRSAANQIEYWAEIGRAVERMLDPEAIIAVQSGLARIKLELTSGEPVAADAVFAQLERDRKSGNLAGAVKEPGAGYAVYQASRDQPGLLERVEADGGVTLGRFHNGEFLPVEV